MASGSVKFRSLGRKTTQFEGFDTFPAPAGVGLVSFVCPEVTAFCPVTGQPDFYTVSIRYTPGSVCLESKSLKLYLQTFREQGLFCEALASKIAAEIGTALEAASVEVEVNQSRRGGIETMALATWEGQHG